MEYYRQGVDNSTLKNPISEPVEWIFWSKYNSDWCVVTEKKYLQWFSARAEAVLKFEGLDLDEIDGEPIDNDRID